MLLSGLGVIVPCRSLGTGRRRQLRLPGRQVTAMIDHHRHTLTGPDSTRTTPRQRTPTSISTPTPRPVESGSTAAVVEAAGGRDRGRGRWRDRRRRGGRPLPVSTCVTDVDGHLIESRRLKVPATGCTANTSIDRGGQLQLASDLGRIDAECLEQHRGRIGRFQRKDPEEDVLRRDLLTPTHGPTSVLQESASPLESSGSCP